MVAEDEISSVRLAALVSDDGGAFIESDSAGTDIPARKTGNGTDSPGAG